MSALRFESYLKEVELALRRLAEHGSVEQTFGRLVAHDSAGGECCGSGALNGEVIGIPLKDDDYVPAALEAMTTGARN